MELDFFRVAVVAAVALTPLFLLRPKLMVYGYLGLIFYFPNVGWGVAENVQVFNLYGKGTGMLPVPLINIALYSALLISLLRLRPERAVLHAFDLRPFVWSMNLLLLAFFVWGLLNGEEFRRIISSNGLVNLFNMSLLSVILIRVFSTGEELNRLANFIVLCAVTRGVWGLLRLIFMDGDPANVYSNIQAIGIDITFFDINDSLISTFSLFFSTWVLANSRTRQPWWQVLFYTLAIVVGILVVVLSYRRSSWGGLALAGAWFVWLQPWNKKILLGSVVGIVALLTITLIVTQRFSQDSHSSRNTGFFYDVLSKQGEVRSDGRLSDLYQAWEHIEENPLTGIKPWGSMDRTRSGEFVHSGFVHLWLKGGFFALLIFCLMLIRYAWFQLTKLNRVPPEKRGVAEAAFAGMLFLIPTLTFGTPIIEYRTTQLMGLLLVTPYLVYGLWMAERMKGLVPSGVRRIPLKL